MRALSDSIDSRDETAVKSFSSEMPEWSGEAAVAAGG